MKQAVWIGLVGGLGVPVVAAWLFWMFLRRKA